MLPFGKKCLSLNADQQGRQKLELGGVYGQQRAEITLTGVCLDVSQNTCGVLAAQDEGRPQDWVPFNQMMREWSRLLNRALPVLGLRKGRQEGPCAWT